MVSIQEFDFVVKHIKGKDNCVADALSRLCVVTRGAVTDGAGIKRTKLLPEEVIGTRSSSRLKEKEVLKASKEDRTGGQN